MEEYYDFVCACGCNGKLKKIRTHKYTGIPKYLTGHHLHGKTLEERCGKEKADAIKQKMSKSKEGHSCPLRGKTYEEFYGKEKAARMVGERYKARTGKTYEELYGKEKADDIKEKMSKGRRRYLGASRRNIDYPKDFNIALIEYIRDRDGYRCRECGRTEIDNKRKLSVHHIDYDKKNCLESNLLALCSRCHGKTGHNRIYWTKKLSKLNENIHKEISIISIVRK